MQFKVPQDVQRADTIVGPLTMKQLIVVAIGGGFAYISYTTLAKIYTWEIWLPPTALIVILTIGFTFAKVHSLTLFQYCICMMQYLFIPRKRIWIQGAAEVQKPLSSEEKKKEEKREEAKEKSLKDIADLVKIVDKKRNP